MARPSRNQSDGISLDVEALFRLHGTEVWKAMLVVSGGRADIADDVTAEAFARLLGARSEVRDPLAWVFRTAFRLAAAELRRESRLRVAEDEGAAADVAPLSAELAGALQALPPAQRAVVFLHYHADMPVSEVARVVGSSVPAVKVRLHRARRSLRRWLEEQEDHCARLVA